MESAERQARLEKLRREAEAEMRRNLDDSGPPRKRSKRQGGPGGPGGAGRADFVPVDRYSYATVGELAAGTKGFLVTTTFRREKSATREASQLLRRYMPAHLFPAPVTEQGQQQQAEAQEQPKEQTGYSEQQQGSGAQGEADVAGGCTAPGAQEGQAQGGGSGGGKGKHAYRAGGGEDGGDSGSEGVSDSDEEGGAGDAPNGTDTCRTGPSALGLVKIGCRGVVLMRLSAEAAAAVDPVAVVEAMLGDVEQGRLQRPRFCQRIVPLDSTCECTPDGWSRAAAQAAAAYRARRAAAAAAATAQGASTPEAPVSFAIAIRTRSNEPSAAGTAEGSSAAAVAAAVPAAASTAPLPGGPAAAQPGGGDARDAAGGATSVGERGSVAAKDGDELDRPRMLSLAATAMSEAFTSCGGAVVNLKKPQVAVLCETVPVAGRRFAGMCVVDQHLFQAKGKLILKALVNGAKP